MAAVQLSVVPVLVHFPSQDDDVTLVELEVTGLFALVAVERLAAGQLRDVLHRTEQTNKLNDVESGSSVGKVLGFCLEGCEFVNI